MNLTFHWPQMVWILIALLGLGRDLANHGKEVTRTENFGTSVIALALVFGLLYAGGFFSQP